MLKQTILKFLLFLFLCFYISDLQAKIINNIAIQIRGTDSLEFNFIQISNGITENGSCKLKRPYYLKCEYISKNQKQLIINKKKLVIFHKRYNKIYNYPLSKSFFTEILNKDAFEKIILNGKLKENDENYIVKCILKEKGDIDFYFDKKDLDLIGWDLISLNSSKISFKIQNLKKNEIIDDNYFKIPKVN